MEHSYVFISNLSALLHQRGKTQRQLALEAGLSTERINRLANERQLHKIVADTTGKICAVLSGWPRRGDLKKVNVGLDALFSLRTTDRSHRSE